MGLPMTKKRLYYQRGRNKGQSISGKDRYYTPRSPKGAPGSDEAILYAGNILYDPGFELFVQNAAPTFLKPGWSDHTGSQVYALPRFDINSPTGQRWPNGDYVDIKDIAQWAQYTEPYVLNDDVREASAWFVQRREASGLDFTTDKGPNAGVFVARWYDWECSGRYPFGNSAPGGLVIQGPGLPAGYSARTEPGALITWELTSWFVETTQASGTMDMCLHFYQQSGALVHTVQSAKTVTNTKTTFTIQSNSPGTSYFIRACVTFRGSGTNDCILAVDSGLLGVE